MNIGVYVTIIAGLEEGHVGRVTEATEMYGETYYAVGEFGWYLPTEVKVHE